MITAMLSQQKLPQQKRAFANYRDHAKFSLFSKDAAIIQSYANHVARIIDQHFLINVILYKKIL